MVECKVIHAKTISEVNPFLHDWSGLCKSLHLPISYDPKWLLAWVESYADDSIEIDISFIYSADKLKAVLPFMIRTEGKNRTLKFLSDSCSDYLGIPFIGDISFDIIDIVLKRFQEIEFTHYNFTNIHEDDKCLPTLINSLSNNGFKLQIELVEKSPLIILNEDFDRNFRCSIAKDQFKRKLKKINELGKIQLKVIQDVSEDLLNEIIRIHIEKWSSNNVFPQFLDDRRIVFIRKIIDSFSEQKEFIVFGLYANEKLIAYKFGCIRDLIYYDWNHSFDICYEKYSPGIVLLINIIQYLQGNGLNKYDFLNGNEKYKYYWATNIVNVYKISGINNNKERVIKEPIITPKLKILKSKKCIIIDLHGIMFKGDIPITPTILGIKKLQTLGVKIGIYTNTSSISVEDLYNKFMSCGLNINKNYIMTSAIAILDYLILKGYKKCYLIGGKPELPFLLESANIDIVQTPQDAQVVVVGFSMEFNYSQLIDAYEAINNGADFICSDADLLYSTNQKNLPGSGWIVSSISSVCNKEPLIIGKPNNFALNLLLDKMEIKPEEAMFIGDNLKSDIAVGKKAGLSTCLQLGGVSELNDVKVLSSSSRPDYIINSFDEIVEVFEKN
jgi:4-nitrophenyl phosphatase